VASPAAAAGEAPSYHIVINLPSRTLSLYAGEALVRRYPVAIGHPQTPSPLGHYRITVEVVDPTWYPKRKPPVPPGSRNPVGSRWLGLSAPNLGIHGTNAPASIGQAVSGGCIRMHNRDVEELSSLVDAGTPVDIVYETVEVGFLPMDGGAFSPGEEAALLFTYGLAVYPDVYQRGATAIGQVEEQIRAAGITAELDRTGLEREVHKAQGSLRPLPIAPRVVVGGRPARRVQWEEGRLWLPLAEAADLLGLPLFVWEGRVREEAGESWVMAAELARRRGYRPRLVPEGAALYLVAPLVFSDGAPVARTFSEGEELLVPVGPLAETLGQTVAVDACLGLAVGEGGRTAEIRWRGEEAYLTPAAAGSLFALEVSVRPEGVWFGPSEEPGEQLGGQLDL
jgi:hypothetical protein